MRAAFLTTLALLGLVFATSLPAQVHFDLGLQTCFYAPATDFPSPQLISFDPRWKQATSLAYGAQAILWHRSLGLAASYMVAPSDVKVSGSAQPNLDAWIRIAALRALLALEVGDLSNTVQLAGGVARVFRRGDAYGDYDHPASTALSLGVGTRFDLLPRLGLDFGLDGLVYSFQLDPGNSQTESTTQVDFIAHVGLLLRLQ